MYVASLDSLSYEIYAVGKTEEECKANLVKGFQQYMKGYHTTLKVHHKMHIYCLMVVVLIQNMTKRLFVK